MNRTSSPASNDLTTTTTVVDDPMRENDGSESFRSFDVVIEVSLGSGVKYEYDASSSRARVDRILSCAMTYPGNYGFVENTLAEDGDCTDVLIVNEQAINTGAIVRCRAIAVLRMQDEKGRDDKIIAVPVTEVDSRYDTVRDLEDLHKSVLTRIRHFFEQYKKTDGPHRWSSVGEYGTAEDAMETLQHHRDAYLQRALVMVIDD